MVTDFELATVVDSTRNGDALTLPATASHPFAPGPPLPPKKLFAADATALVVFLIAASEFPTRMFRWTRIVPEAENTLSPRRLFLNAFPDMVPPPFTTPPSPKDEMLTALALASPLTLLAVIE